MKLVGRPQQGGATLLVALVMLLLLTLLASSSMHQTLLQNRTGGSVVERSRAFNAAEAALREGERRLLAARGLASFTAFSAGFDRCSDSVEAIGTNLCILTRVRDLKTTNLVHAWAATALKATEDIAPLSVIYRGSDNASVFLPRPRWVVTPIAGSLDGGAGRLYRITAVAQFGTGRFPVILQSVVVLEGL